MAVTQRRKTLVNSARRRRKNAGRRRKLTPAQIAAGFGGKRRQSAMKTRRKAKRKNRSVAKSRPVRRTRTVHARRAVRRNKRRAVRRVARRKNLGKIISYSLPKEQSTVANTKRNRGRRRASSHTTRRRRTTRKNTGHRRRTYRRNPGLGDLTGLAQTALFTVAGAVGTKYLTQAVLQSSNTGAMGYFGNAVAAFALSWGINMFTKNKAMAHAVLAGGFVQIVLRLITDYTPFGQYTANIGMGDWQCAGMGVYTKQNAPLPYRMVDGLHSAQIANYQNYNTSGTNGMGCYGYGSDALYGFAAA